MGLFSNQLANVVEWEEYRDDVLFWKWSNDEIKKGSKLIIRQGQDAIFMYNGKVEGIFKDEGSYDIETQIIPFLSTLKGFKFGFNSGMRAEVLFINTKQFNIKWGTPKPIRVQAPGLPGGLPIRANGTFDVKVGDYLVFIEKIAGIKKQYSINEVREVMQSMLSGLLVRWISKVGQDIFNLQANIIEIQDGVKTDLDMEFVKIGLSVVSFRIDEFSYPENITKRADQAAEHSMIGDMNRFQQVSMVDAMTSNNGSGGGRSSDMMNTMMGAQMGMMMGQQMMNSMNQNNQNAGMQNSQMGNAGGAVPKFCPNCGTPTNGNKFCGNCGNKLA
ncbi:MAG: SPFH domain-containing protein [Bacteroides sp.]|nr:SPFH domain-containing protein [Bacteroides sp.]MCM1550449.1 SPFH domain-containing protein [Clostridium sp.]